MVVTDIDLYMKFQRQPRIIGTVCYYAPTNKLLIPDGIKRGDQVFIINYTQSKDDVYVTIAHFHHWNWRTLGNSNNPTASEATFKEFIKEKIPPNEQIMVIWKDLAS